MSTTDMIQVMRALPEPPTDPTELQQYDTAVERLLILGDIGVLSPAMKVRYVFKLCEKYKLDFLSRPFEYIKLPDGKEILYAKKTCAEQLRANHSVSVQVIEQTYIKEAGVLSIRVRASLPDGRFDEEIGAVYVGFEGAMLPGNDFANAVMKAITKAKRRATLSICGLGGFMDESEIEGIRGAVPLNPNAEMEAGQKTLRPQILPPPVVPTVMPTLGEAFRASGLKPVGTIPAADTTGTEQVAVAPVNIPTAIPVAK